MSNQESEPGVTANHALKLPYPGQPDWNVPLNENFESIDEQVEIRDAEENLGQYEPKEGAKFLATDSERIFVGDGSNWQALPSIGREGHLTGRISVDDDGRVRGKNLLTGSRFGPDSDAGTVIENLINNISAESPQDRRGNMTVGPIALGRGVYTFDSTATIDAPGVKLVGTSDYEWMKDGPTMFTPTDNLDDQTGMLRVESNALALENVVFDMSNQDVYGIHIWDSDRHNIRRLSIENVGPGGEGLRVSGSYQSTIEQCQIRQAHFRINPNSGKNVNNTIIDKCLFQHTHGSVDPIKIVGTGNEVHGCRINQGDANPAEPGVNGIGKSPTGPAKGWIFGNCKLFGDDNGDVMIRGRKLRFVGCGFGGGGDAIFERLTDNSIVGCEFNINHQVVKIDGSNNQLDRGLFVGNVVQSNQTGGTAAFERVSGGKNTPRNERVAIVGNVFAGDGDYDISLDPNGIHSGTIRSNYLLNGVHENWSGSTDVTIANNHGYNPVGFDRSTPSLPGGTGSGSSVLNNYAQQVTVHHTGHSGVHVVDTDGSDRRLDSDPDSVTVPPFGRVYYDGSIPDAWDWYWH